MERVEIFKKNGIGYKLIIHLFQTFNPKTNYATRICREVSCDARNMQKIIGSLIKAKIIETKREGRIKYLKLTDKGRKLALILYEVRELFGS